MEDPLSEITGEEEGIQLAPRPPLAAVAGLPEARPDVDAASGRYLELLPREGSLRESRSDQQQHRATLRRGRAYRDHEYLRLKVQKATATRRPRRTA
jgi:hypothetical protein